MNKFKGYTNAEKALQMIIDLTGDLGGGNSLSEKLQRLLDLPCEFCNDGEVIRVQQTKIDRLSILLGNCLMVLEGQTGEGILDTDLEDEIGITREEYNEVMCIDEKNNTELNTEYDPSRFIYAVAIECVKGGEEYYEEYEPESQKWEDIILKFESEKNKLIDEISEDFGDNEPQEWMLNGYQPITQYKCDNGDWYEIYVLSSEK